MASFYYHSCLYRNPLPWLAALGSFLAFSYSSDLGFLTVLLTSSALILLMFCSKTCQQKSEVEHEDTSTDGEEVLVSSSDTVSDSESFDHRIWSDGSENDWTSKENLSHSTQCSDGSISDEEGLIEIALPEGHYLESSKTEEVEDLPCYGYQHKWVEMLMEEDNLIEIDICMGSIKCSRFEIEA